MLDEATWRKTIQSPGGKAVCMSPKWLLNGCPHCGGKSWQVTDDCWAYCNNCSIGIPTNYPFTAPGSILSILDENGVRDWQDAPAACGESEER